MKEELLHIHNVLRQVADILLNGEISSYDARHLCAAALEGVQMSLARLDDELKNLCKKEEEQK